ncbi:sigma-70 family RNA polymerase sigma factor [Tolypothrix bouteillei VB521301_2]|uniref:RNA polymerase sigma factor n=1 Tax=Tolypothrix bouteillei TaxID=1246981 RepID=UPI001386D55D|nr:sigma-70 family RNA polymerase sigma factor [Tolypothrix bouteillei]
MTLPLLSRVVEQAGVSEQSDPELIFLARQGDKAAFGRLVLRYQPMAQRIAEQMLGNKDLASDLVQEAMLQAYLSLKKLHQPKRFKSWLYGIVLNICRNELRRRKVIVFSLEAMVGDLADAPFLIDEKAAPEQVAEHKELRIALLEAIDTLSHSNRQATLLFYHEQLSLQEVAVRLNISVNAVKGRLHKARHQLRERLLPLQGQIQSISFKESKIMTDNTSAQIKSELCCSFCKKSREQVNLLIAGPPLGDVTICICNECVDICNQIISREISVLAKQEIEPLKDSAEMSG